MQKLKKKKSHGGTENTEKIIEKMAKVNSVKLRFSVPPCENN